MVHELRGIAFRNEIGVAYKEKILKFLNLDKSLSPQIFSLFLYFRCKESTIYILVPGITENLKFVPSVAVGKFWVNVSLKNNKFFA